MHLERVARETGLNLVALRVFGHNRAARDLYAKVGYEEMDFLMLKQLP